MTHDLPISLTPLQRRCAGALLDAGGSISAAAADLGMSEKRLRDHIAKAVARGWECPEPPAVVPTPPPTRGMVDLDALIIDPALQPRVEIDPSTVDEYAAIYEDHGPEGMDPIRVYRHLYAADLILTRGFTRVAAARQAGLDQLPAEIHLYGADTDALIDSLSGNRHGQRLTTADKRRALVLYHAAIEVDAWASTRAVAHLIGCSHDMVASFRRELIDQVADSDATPADASDALVAAVGAASMDDVRLLIADMLPDLTRAIADRPDLKPIPEIKARILLAVYLATRIPDPDFDDDGSPLTRDRLAELLGTCLDVHPGQLVRGGWISGDHAAGYTITQQGHDLCRPLDDLSDDDDDDDADDADDDDDDADDAPPCPRTRRNLAGELHMLVAAQDGEPLDVAKAAEELDTDGATILALASTHPGLRATEREVGRSRVPAVELVPSDPDDLVQTDDDADEASVDLNAAEQARANRHSWIIEQARPTIAQRGAIPTRAAQLVALHLGLDYDDAEPYIPPPAATRGQVDAEFCAAALDMLQRIAATRPNAWYDRHLVALLPAIAADIGLDWPAIETAAAARFGGGFRGASEGGAA